jgi:hypothetical protein
MAWMVTVLLFGLWVLGMASGATLGYWVHIFLAFALVSLIVALSGMSRRRVGVR